MAATQADPNAGSANDRLRTLIAGVVALVAVLAAAVIFNIATARISASGTTDAIAGQIVTLGSAAFTVLGTIAGAVVGVQAGGQGTQAAEEGRKGAERVALALTSTLESMSTRRN